MNGFCEDNADKYRKPSTLNNSDFESIRKTTRKKRIRTYFAVAFVIVIVVAALLVFIKSCEDSRVVEKPVLYLYPERTEQIQVRLELGGTLTCTYPAYREGWIVTAEPDGILRDVKGQTYNYLYWEAETDVDWDLSRGFCVRGEDTASFLEDALTRLGLNRREANEFIVYWLPRMERNPWNRISFQSEPYEEAARLEIMPEPDVLIRVFMVFEALESPVELEPQPLTMPERTGFTAVEWGGCELTP